NKQASESAYNGYVQEGARGESGRASTVGKSKESETLSEDWRRDMRRRNEIGHPDSWGDAYTHSEFEANNMTHIRTSDGTSDMRGGEMAERTPSRSAPQDYGMAPDPVPSASLTGEWRESQRGDGSGTGPSANQQAADSAYNGYVQESMRGGSSRVSTVGESKESETLYKDWRHKMRRRSEVGHVDSWGNAYTHSEIEAKNMIHIWTPDGKSDMRGGDYIGYYKFRGSISHDRPVTQETYDLDQQRITQLIEAGDSGLQSDLAKWSRRWWWRVSEKDYEQRMAKLRSRA
ncbi:MAG TPA: hypothetical protein VFL86_05370, partial [Burkholderiaceae bacterium]|nr:hypothetical protein [Burkholderiaceae bacterium]